MISPYEQNLSFTCLIRVRSLLSMRCMLLGYSFKPKFNGHVLGTAGSVMTVSLSVKGFLHLENWCEDGEEYD